MKTKFSDHAAISQETEIATLLPKLGEAAQTTYRNLLIGQELSRQHAEARMIQQRDGKITEEFARLLKARLKDREDGYHPPGPKLDIDEVVEKAKEDARINVGQQEIRQEQRDEKLRLETRWHVVKSETAALEKPTKQRNETIRDER